MRLKQPGAFFLIILVLVSLQAVAARALDVTSPLGQDGDGRVIANPYMHESFLDYLKSNSVYPVLGKDGVPLFYYSENKAFGCTGICDTVSTNGYTLGSRNADLSSTDPARLIDSSLLMGDSATQEATNTLNAMRQSLSGNPEGLDLLERQILENQEGAIKGSYMSERYGSVWDYALEKLQQDPSAYNNLLNNVAGGNLPASAGALDDYLKSNFNINSAFDASSLYSALESGMLGPMQSAELMENVLDQLSGQLGKNMDLSKLSEYSPLMNTPEFRQAMENALNEIEKNPESYQRMKDMINSMMQDEQSRQVLRDLMTEMIKKGDWEALKNLSKIFSELGNSKELMAELMKGITEHMREMIANGKMDEISKLLDDPEMKQMFDEALKAFSESFFEQLQKYIGDFLGEYAYVLAVVAVAAALLVFYRMKI